MNFLIDAQLPRRLVYRLRDMEHDALHTLDLPDGNGTPDADINELSIHESRAVITKDTDFVDSFLLFGEPYKFLLVSTGNIANAELEKLFVSQIPAIVLAFATYEHLELTNTTLVFHS